MFAGVLYFSNNAKIGFECVYPDDEVQVHLQLGMAILLDWRFLWGVKVQTFD